MDIRVDLSELDHLMDRWADIDRVVKNELVTASDRGGQAVRREGNRVINRRSGDLQDTAKVTTTVNRRGATTLIAWVSKHARAVARGRRAVFPISAKALRWVTPAGQIVFSKRAKATEGQHYDRIGKANAAPVILAAFERAASNVARWSRAA